MRAKLHLILPLSLLTLGLGLAACSGGGGGGGGNPAAPPTPGLTIVEVQDNFFSPRSVDVEPGDTVRWVLRGATLDHTVNERNGAFSSGGALSHSGGTFEHTFTTADTGKTFEYDCNTHQGCCMMQGSVRVGASAPAPSPGY